MAGLEAYVAERGRGLLRMAYMPCGDRHLAEDLVQEVLARMHRRRAWEDTDHLDAYVRVAVVRQFLSWRRRGSGNEARLATGPEPATAGPADAHAERDAMWAELAGLPRQQRAVLVLRYYEDLPDERIGELVGCAPSTDRMHAARALATLRERRGLPTGTSEERTTR